MKTELLPVMGYATHLLIIARKQSGSSSFLGSEEDPEDGEAAASAIFGAVFVYIVSCASVILCLWLEFLDFFMFTLEIFYICIHILMDLFACFSSNTSFIF